MNLFEFAYVHDSIYERIKDINKSGDSVEQIRKSIEKEFKEDYESQKGGFSNSRKINVPSTQADFAWHKTFYKNPPQNNFGLNLKRIRIKIVKFGFA